MGRKPKDKTVPMPSLIGPTVDIVDTHSFAEQTNMKPNFTHRAVTLWYNTTNDTWNLVQVMIDPVTSSSGEMTVLMTDRHQSIVFEALKMELYKMVEN